MDGIRQTRFAKKPYLQFLLWPVLLAWGCADKELDVSAEMASSELCDPQGPLCADGLACEPLLGSDTHICAARLELRGRVFDALVEEPIEGALVVAADEMGTPVSAISRTDADGRYSLPVSVPRDDTGEIADARRWTLMVSASGYLSFPRAVRPALPIDIEDAVADDEDPTVLGAIDNASTTVALLPRSGADGVTITGSVDAPDAAGTLVVAEGLDPAPFAVADRDGAFTLFDAPPGSASLRGYRRGLALAPLNLEVTDADIADVRLVAASDDVASMSVVSGSVAIVDAPGGAATSVVLIPSSVYDQTLERGPVPIGLRAPSPPEAPSISSSFVIDGVPAGRYHVLAAFENDELVRDPDETIAGTQVQQIEVTAGEDVALDQSFKITEALAVIGPGAEGPEEVGPNPVLSWSDDSSETRYEVVVRDALGEEHWRDDQLPAVMGRETVDVPYDGPPLVSGMYYQFRVTAWRDTPNGSTALARTEDLRGVFVLR